MLLLIIIKFNGGRKELLVHLKSVLSFKISNKKMELKKSSAKTKKNNKSISKTDRINKNSNLLILSLGILIKSLQYLSHTMSFTFFQQEWTNVLNYGVWEWRRYWLNFTDIWAPYGMWNGHQLDTTFWQEEQIRWRFYGGLMCQLLKEYLNIMVKYTRSTS